METISVQPTSASYSVASIGDRLSAKLDGPASFVGRMQVDTPQLVTLLWVVGFDDFETLRSVFRKNAARGNPPWQINLALLGEDLPIAHIIKFVKNSIQFQSRGGITYNISAKAYAMSAHPTTDYPGFKIFYKVTHDYGITDSNYIYDSPSEAAMAAQISYETYWGHPHDWPPPNVGGRGRYYTEQSVPFIVIGGIVEPYLAPYTYNVYHMRSQEYPPGTPGDIVGSVIGRFIPLN